jgi:putative hemolysin
VFERTARGLYTLDLAETDREVALAQRLRYVVFNLELGEGLERAHTTGRDADEFDYVCDHLLVREVASGEVVGTYRLQSGWVAAANHGYYSAQEFDLRNFEAVRHEVLELGRACVHPHHRNLRVLALLWRGIVAYAAERRLRYLLGCSSVRTQDEGAAWALYQQLRVAHEAPPAWQCAPRPACRCRADVPARATLRPPKLLMAYLSFGAKIGGAPAIDREFGTIDYLTILDREQLAPPDHVRNLLFPSSKRNTSMT